MKKSVNQDDVSLSYHLSSMPTGSASPGTDITFFDFGPRPPERRGGAKGRVQTWASGWEAEQSLAWWKERFDEEKGVKQAGASSERDGPPGARF